jgi:DNA repair exonuclease SbcCD ATPase subunit
MSEGRLAEIRKTAQQRDYQHLIVLGDCDRDCPVCAVDDLLAEAERLSIQATYMREQIEQLSQLAEERKAQTVAYRALAEAHQKRGDKLSAQMAEADETRDSLAVAMELLNRLADDAECWFDQHGYRQRHSQYKTPCPHPPVRQLVAAWRDVEREAPDV